LTLVTCYLFPPLSFWSHHAKLMVNSAKNLRAAPGVTNTFPFYKEGLRGVSRYLLLPPPLSLSPCPECNRGVSKDHPADFKAGLGLLLDTCRLLLPPPLILSPCPECNRGVSKDHSIDLRAGLGLLLDTCRVLLISPSVILERSEESQGRAKFAT
jgi:endogenous inhibitor of DNA gyrase (YacG/DUF329 family)